MDSPEVRAVLAAAVSGDLVVEVRVVAVQVAAGRRKCFLRKNFLNYSLHNENIHLHTKRFNTPNSSFALMIKSVRFASGKVAR